MKRCFEVDEWIKEEVKRGISVKGKRAVDKGVKTLSEGVKKVVREDI